MMFCSLYILGAPTHTLTFTSTSYYSPQNLESLPMIRK